KLRAAIFVSKGLKFPNLHHNKSSIAWHKSVHVAAVAALSLNIIATAAPALIAQYGDTQARIPHALAANENLSSPPAADAESSGDKAVNLSSTLKDQLAD